MSVKDNCEDVNIKIIGNEKYTKCKNYSFYFDGITHLEFQNYYTKMKSLSFCFITLEKEFCLFSFDNVYMCNDGLFVNEKFYKFDFEFKIGYRYPIVLLASGKLYINGYFVLKFNKIDTNKFKKYFLFGTNYNKRKFLKGLADDIVIYDYELGVEKILELRDYYIDYDQDCFKIPFDIKKDNFILYNKNEENKNDTQILNEELKIENYKNFSISFFIYIDDKNFDDKKRIIFSNYGCRKQTLFELYFKKNKENNYSFFFRFGTWNKEYDDRIIVFSEINQTIKRNSIHFVTLKVFEDNSIQIYTDNCKSEIIKRENKVENVEVNPIWYGWYNNCFDKKYHQFIGKIYNFKYYNKILSDEEIIKIRKGK